MSADQDLSIDQSIKTVLPPELLAKAKSLAGETAWSADDALEVIKSSSAAGVAISGVELWQEDDGFPKWIATSDYKYDKASAEYAALCAKSAADFVQRFRTEIGALFNLS